MKFSILFILFFCAAPQARPQCAASDSTARPGFCSGTPRFEAHIGYAVGGTAPVGMPATIRALDSYTLQPNWALGAGAEWPLSGRWGLVVSLNSDNKDMKLKAKVKNYHIEITRGGETLAGYFTGHVQTRVAQWMVTVPVQAAFHPTERLRVRFGPYVSVVLTHEFTGYAYDGHLRVDTPTGKRVDLGTAQTERGYYDFSSHLRHVQAGLDIAADYRVGRKWGVYAGLSWGLTGVHHSGFKTIEQTLYPIYGHIGLNYRFRNPKQKL